MLKIGTRCIPSNIVSPQVQLCLAHARYYYYFLLCSVWLGHAVAHLVKTLRYKPDDCWLDSLRGYWDSSLT
jgi:hypothetical protein